MSGRARARRRAVAVALCLLAVAGPAAARALAPAADVSDRFAQDPAANPSWQLEGPWRWDAGRRKLLSAATAPAAAHWLASDHYAGKLTVRLKLLAGRGRRPPKARLVFARDPETLAFRYVELTGGTRGRVALGQSGEIAGAPGGTIRSRRFPVRKGAWITASVLIAPTGRVTVRVGNKKAFSVAAGPLAPGEVGVAAVDSRISVDSVVFVGAPDGEPCLDCHAGQPGQPLAPNVATYWDGSWWRANRGGSSGMQYGGHGDPGGKAAVACAGAEGCHDLRQPDPADHRNGLLEGPGRPTRNSFHLRGGFIPERRGDAWDAQVTFDRYCYVACHKGRGVPFFSHELDGVPARGAMEFGTHLTVANGESTGLPLDSDITTLTSPSRPNYAPCVSCHDPHGTGSPDAPRRSNYMLRAAFQSSAALCKLCHR